MRSIAAGLCLSLVGGVAWAQTPPNTTPPPKPPAAEAAPAAPDAQARTSDAAPEGEIIETPNGFFLVRPGQGPQPLDIRPPLGRTVPTDMAGPDTGAAPPHPPRPPHPGPEGKGARFEIHAPNLNLSVKCPDDEPIKACVDAIGVLLDKAGSQPHS